MKLWGIILIICLIGGCINETYVETPTQSEEPKTFEYSDEEYIYLANQTNITQSFLEIYPYALIEVRRGEGLVEYKTEEWPRAINTFNISLVIHFNNLSMKPEKYHYDCFRDTIRHRYGPYSFKNLISFRKNECAEWYEYEKWINCLSSMPYDDATDKNISEDRCPKTSVRGPIYTNPEELEGPDSCNETENVYGMSNCYYFFARKLNDSSLCDKVTYEPDKSNCYGIMASRLRDIELCNKIISNYDRGLCRNSITGKANDTAFCEKIDDQEKDYCYYNVAVKLNNETICDKIKGENWNFICTVELTVDNVGFCDEIDDVSFKDSCYTIMATKLNSTSICEKIEDKNRYYGCILDVKWNE